MKFIQKIAEALKYTFADKKTVDEMPETIMADIAEELTKEYLIPYSGPTVNCSYYIISEHGVQDQDQISTNNGFYAKYGETIAYVWIDITVDENGTDSYDTPGEPLQTFIINSDIIRNGINIDMIRSDPQE